MESLHSLRLRFKESSRAFSWVHLSNAFIALLFAGSAPVAIILGVGVSGGLSQSDLSSWIFGAFTLNGVLTIAMSILYRAPLAFFWTIPGTVLVGPALKHLSLSDIIGAYHATGLLLLVLGLTGTVRRVMIYLPLPIIMGMVAGVFIRFGLRWLESFEKDIWIALPMTAAYFTLGSAPKLQKRVPPMIGVLVVGVIVLALRVNTVQPSANLGSNHLGEIIVTPRLYLPTFSWRAFVELVLPLSITVIAAQNAQGIAILQAREYQPPVNSITTACGLGSLGAALCGCVPSCLTGPCTAILVSSEQRAGEFVAAVALGLFALIFGLFSPLFTTLMLSTPPAFIATLAGLALLKVLQNAFQTSFRDRFSLGALIAFMVTLADQTLLSIGAPFWSLLFGWTASRLLEHADLTPKPPVVLPPTKSHTNQRVAAL